MNNNEIENEKSQVKVVRRMIVIRSVEGNVLAFNSAQLGLCEECRKYLLMISYSNLQAC